MAKTSSASRRSYLTDPKKAIYRIYRDTRFSNDKTPYKTHVAASFNHKALVKHTAAGFYFHLSPDEILMGGGVYMPGSSELLAIRRHISADPAAYEALTKARPFKRYFGEVTGAKLSRPPKGFAADDPAHRDAQAEAVSRRARPSIRSSRSRRSCCRSSASASRLWRRSSTT